MLRQAGAAVAFLTRIPVPARWVFTAEDVGRASPWFPVVGGLLGLALGGLGAALCGLGAPPALAAALVLVASALLTGALHLDAVADMADGFGGGRTREDVLRIMRDHVIGAYGATALILLLAVQLTALGTLLDRGAALRYLVAALALGRWGAAPLSYWLPYARREGGLGAALTEFVGGRELFGASAAALLFVLGAAPGEALWLVAAAGLVTWRTGVAAHRRIGGVTGDVLGANTALVETAVLVAGVFLTGGDV